MKLHLILLSILSSIAVTYPAFAKDCQGDICVGDTVRTDHCYAGNQIGRVLEFDGPDRFTFINPANNDTNVLDLRCFVKANQCAECLGDGLCLGDIVKSKRDGSTGLMTGILSGSEKLGDTAVAAGRYGVKAEDLEPYKPSGMQREHCGPEEDLPIIADN